MNIKGRLKKVESQIIIPDSKHCSCLKKMEIHCIEPRLDEPKGYCTHCSGVCTFDASAPCVLCGKPVLSKFIKVKPREEEEYEGEYV